MASTHQNEFVTSTGVRWDDPEEGKTWLVSLISVVTLAALIVFLSVIYFRGEQSEYDVKIVDQTYTSLVAAKEAQKELLTRSGPYATLVGSKDVTRQRMPIGEAMKSVVANPKLAVPPVGPAIAKPAATATATPASTAVPAGK